MALGYLSRRCLRFLILAALVSGCAAGHCKGSKRAPVANPEAHIFVYKAEGSKQCQPATGLPIEKVAEDLGKIQLFSQATRSDGKMHMTLCGAATGRIHIFEILESDRATALKAGFQLLESKADAK